MFNDDVEQVLTNIKVFFNCLSGGDRKLNIKLSYMK